MENQTKILDQPFDSELCQARQKEQLIILDVKIYPVQEKVPIHIELFMSKLCQQSQYKLHVSGLIPPRITYQIPHHITILYKAILLRDRVL